jgi:hypothetical protein
MTDSPSALPAAFRFDDAESVHDALIEYGAARRQLDAARDLLIVAARQHDVPWSRIQALTGVAKSTISRIPDRPAATEGLVEAVATYRRILHMRGAALGTWSNENEAEHRKNGARLILDQCYQALSGGLSVPRGFPRLEDGILFALRLWLAEYAAESYAAQPHGGWTQGIVETAEQVIAEIDVLRASGELPEPEASAATAVPREETEWFALQNP